MRRMGRLRRRARARVERAITMVVFVCVSATAGAQWQPHPTVGIPRTADGQPDLRAPAPRTADGRPDLSGVWLPSPDLLGTAGGIVGTGAAIPRYLRDITVDLPRDYVRLQPKAAEEFQRRVDNVQRDSPLIRCLPVGVPRLNAYAFPFKFVQLPHLIAILYETQTMFRQVFMDGRALPKDPQPTWMGYSVGRWESDTLVVESTGFNGRPWLDGVGHTFSEAMRLTERFRRHDVGRMDVEVIIDDPQTYTAPLRYVQPLELLPDRELIEYVCENPKEVFRPRSNAADTR
jgi:hypothetical protein